MPGAAAPENAGGNQTTPAAATLEATAVTTVASPHPSAPAVAVGSVKPEQAPPQIAANVAETVTTRIARAVQDGAHTLTMELHPAELGRVEVRMSFHEGSVGVQMTLDRPETYDAFVRDRGVMEQHLASAGINLSSGGLDMRFGQQSDRPAQQTFSQTAQLSVQQDDTNLGPRPPNQSRRDGLIDILA